MASTHLKCGHLRTLYRRRAVAIAPISGPMFAACSDLGTSDASLSTANFVFAPPHVVIEAGQSATWINDYGASHGVVIADVSDGTDPLPSATFSRHFDNERNATSLCRLPCSVLGIDPPRGSNQE